MDGSLFKTVRLSDVVEVAMKHHVTFSQLRQNVYLWMREHRYTVLTTERVGDHGVYSILITYWDDSGTKVSRAFDECSSYTTAQPISTW